MGDRENSPDKQPQEWLSGCDCWAFLWLLWAFSQFLNVCTSFQFQHTEFKELVGQIQVTCLLSSWNTNRVSWFLREMTSPNRASPSLCCVLIIAEDGCDSKCVGFLTSKQAVISAADSNWVSSNPTRAATVHWHQSHRLRTLSTRLPMILFLPQLPTMILRIFFLPCL